MSLLPLDKGRPLLQTAVRQGCWDLPLSYLRRLANHLGFELKDLTLLEAIMRIAQFAIPPDELDDKLMESILAARSVAFEERTRTSRRCATWSMFPIASTRATGGHSSRR